MRHHRLPHPVCATLLALLAAMPGQAEELRFRALLMAPVTEGGTATADRGPRGEARVIVHGDGRARLDLVSWALPEGPVEAALRLDAPADAAAPLLVVPLERDADEGRVIGAGFRLDANAAQRLRAGAGEVLLTSGRRTDVAIHGALRLRPGPPVAIDSALHAAD